MLNKRSWLLCIRIRLRGMKPHLNLFIPILLFIPHQWLLSWEAILSLIPGSPGHQIRKATDTIHGMLIQLIKTEPQNIADIKIHNHKQYVRVLVRTIGLSGGDDF